MSDNREKGIAIVWVVLITALLSLAAGGAGTYWYVTEVRPEPAVTTPPPLPTATPTPSTPVTAPITADWKTYSNTDQNLSFQYPPTWTIEKNTFDQSIDWTDLHLKSGDANLYLFVNDPGRGFENYSVEVSKSKITVGSIQADKSVLEESPESAADKNNIKRAIIVKFTKPDSGGADGDNEDDFFIFFSYPKAKDQSSVFDQLIGTFQFTR